MTGKKDVAQLVLRTEFEDGEKYLLALRTTDELYEWIGGKKEEGESLEEAAVREMKEEIKIEWRESDFEVEKFGDAYLSSKDDRFRLNPVLISVSPEVARNIEDEDLSREHSRSEWIDIKQFDEYNTLGQYRALDHLDIVNGGVALAAVKKDEEVLLVQRSEENSTPGKWGLVSGGIESGETPEEAAVRELSEETGLEAEPVEKGDFFIGEGEHGYWRLEPVLMEHVSGEVNLNWELSQHEWIKPEKIEEKDKIGEMKGLEKLELVE